MTPAARVAAAIEVLDLWRDGTPAEKALTTWARGARYAGSKDRAAVRDHVYEALRQMGNAAALGGGDAGRALMLGLLRCQGIAPETVFTGDGHAPAPLSEAEKAVSDIGPEPWRDIPGWLHGPLRESLGDQADSIVAAMDDRAPLYLRVNTRKGTVSEARKRLSSDGLKTEDLSSGALEVLEGRRRLRQAQAYLDGVVEIQDLSVQRACSAVTWPASGRILDYCAGGGGKTLAIADHSKAQLFAHDANPQRMTDLAERAARAGVRYTALKTAEVARSAPYDLVLCDVPCSGSGTWRRDPEAKWRLTEDRLTELGRVQREILHKAQDLVGPGGRVVYMTCSLLNAENRSVVEEALNRPGWQLLQDRHFSPLTESDGFYLAEMQKDAVAR